MLPGATVTATHTDTGTSYEAVTGTDGRYSILNVRVGTYTVAATMSGFKDQKQEKIQVQLGAEQTRRLQAAARLGQRDGRRRRDVAARSTLSRAGTADNIIERGHRIAADDLAQRLRLRRASARISTRGATRRPTTPSVSVAGRNNRYNGMQIDGAVNNDVFGLRVRRRARRPAGTQPISLDAIQEIQLVVSPYDVRQGGFTGGGINAITKSGTNTCTARALLRPQPGLGRQGLHRTGRSRRSATSRAAAASAARS